MRNGVIGFMSVVALVAAGCGGSGGGGERLSLEDFVAQADAICKEYEGKLDALGEPKTMSDLADLVREGKAVASEQMVKLRELSPPGEIEASVDEAYATLDQQIRLFDDLIEAASAEDTAKVNEIVEQGTVLDDKADALAKKVGLKECGSTS